MSSLRNTYWNPYLETMPQEGLRQLQLAKFRRIIAWAYERSPFYRELYGQAGLEPGDIKTWDDVRRVPKVDKGMLKLAQEAEPFPYGSRLCVPLEQVAEFRQTSGTTGTPVYQADTWQDWEWWSESWCYILWAQGYRPRDRVFIPFGYNIFVAFWAGHYAAEKLGCEVVPGGVLDTAARVLKIKELKATALMGTPTYMLNMADVAKNRLGIDPAGLTIERITCAGEPGASLPSTKRRMEEAWGAKVFDHAGATEIGAWSYECSQQPGGIHANQGLFLVEIEDLVTGEIIEEPGKKGKMIITALDRQAQPCLRFDSKDLIEWAAEPCPCGRTYRVIKGGVQGRADDITKVKGVLLSPSAIEEVVRGFDELADEYEVLVERIGDNDKITLKIEMTPGAQSREKEVLARLKDQLRLKTNLGYQIEVHPLGSLTRYEVKARRFKDTRQLH
ncbi:MAG: phenylacetate--CoA ligase family protein [Proteobacteria bacterium]|nr:phenylacetate--CoA ligase family protein [Pseudomonadota bacterium]MBU1450817.1 phenylacetate--CoA ligase family protein [Pseudomonadota bacterium]MBU2468799.1 phenylacetate--CoA ligase family protein [Pseudomonadota bacterium]MBU2516849.1 phenylacetate--CoA ligase family protein [Pseudomonadota bacterium]